MHDFVRSLRLLDHAVPNALVHFLAVFQCGRQTITRGRHLLIGDLGRRSQQCLRISDQGSGVVTDGLGSFKMRGVVVLFHNMQCFRSCN